MIKLVFCCHRNPEMSRAEFQDYWLNRHGPLVRSLREQLPQMLRYVQSHTRATAYGRGEPPALDGFALTWFENTAAMRESALSPEYARTRADEDNFVTVPLDFIITKEQVILG